MPELLSRALVVTRSNGAEAPVQALAGVDLSIDAGELVAVMGPAGAGKSTLALALAGLETPTSGSIDGAGAGATRLVLQRPESSFLASTTLDEVMLAPLARGEPDVVATRHARDQLAALALTPEHEARDPLTLSGGEQRRVAIAATLAAQAQVLVLDEPSAGLDRAARGALHSAIATLHAAGRTIIVITHDPDEAASLASRLVVLRDGRIAWDGPVAPVLGDPRKARDLGIAVAPEVQLLHDVARVRGQQLGHGDATARAATARLVELLAMPAPAATVQPAAAGRSGVDAGSDRRGIRRALEPLVDARVRVVTTAFVLVAALAAGSLLAAAIVLLACSVVVALAPIGRARVSLAVRPLVALTILLVAMQLLVGGAPDVDLRHGVPATHEVAPALMRAMQAAAVVLATLALSACTPTLDLATALRRLLAPLRIVRIPVASLAFVTATGLGLVPTMSDELERLRLAQRARGLRPASSSGRGGAIARFRADAQLVGPLFVAAFRRAHLLADALAVRGIDPRRPLAPWRAMVVPRVDLLLLLVGIALVAVSRFA